MGPYQNFHGISKKFGSRKIFKLAPCLPPRCLASPDTWPPTDRARDGRGRFGGLQVHQEGELLEEVQLSLKHQHQLIQTSCLPARFSSALHFCPPCPPAVPASFAFSRLTCWILV